MNHLYLTSVLNFGKYKGQRLVDVIGRDPEYVIWLVKNTDNDIDAESEEVLKEFYESKTGKSYSKLIKT